MSDAKTVSAAFDTQVLIWMLPWGLSEKTKRRKTSQDVAEMQRRARVMLADLEQEGARIIVPMVAIAEFLVGIEQARHGDVIAEFHKRFFCPPFDVRACSLSARLEQAHRQLAPEEQLERKWIRPDAMIVATACVHGATTFYSHERRVRNMATQAGMAAKDLPTHSEDMFVDHESRQLKDEK